jgi:hypothetical protein
MSTRTTLHSLAPFCDDQVKDLKLRTKDLHHQAALHHWVSVGTGLLHLRSIARPEQNGINAHQCR